MGCSKAVTAMMFPEAKAKEIFRSCAVDYSRLANSLKDIINSIT